LITLARNAAKLRRGRCNEILADITVARRAGVAWRVLAKVIMHGAADGTTGWSRPEWLALARAEC
jgi:hypothetical protein